MKKLPNILLTGDKALKQQSFSEDSPVSCLRITITNEQCRVVYSRI